MKNILLTTVILTFALSAFASEKKTLLRTLKCEGVVESEAGAVRIFFDITDYKIKIKDETGTFTEYSTTASITDPENPEKMIAAITNNPGDEDPQPLRDAPRDGAWGGLSFFDLMREGSKGGKMNRDGLLVLGSKQLPPEKKSSRLYEVGITMGEVTDSKAKGFNGFVLCNLVKGKL